jgi:hypothetical protein
MSGGYLVLQLHDELIYEVCQEDVLPVLQIIQCQMENAMKLSVRLPVKVKVGPSLGKLEELNLVWNVVTCRSGKECNKIICLYKWSLEEAWSSGIECNGHTCLFICQSQIGTKLGKTRSIDASNNSGRALWSITISLCYGNMIVLFELNKTGYLDGLKKKYI